MSTAQAFHSFEAEQAVLGCIILDRASLDKITQLEPKHFFDPRHRLLYEYMRYLHEFNEEIEIVSIAEALSKAGKLEEAGGVTYFTELAGTQASAALITKHSELIISKYMRRKTAEAARKILMDTQDPSKSDVEIVAAAESTISEAKPVGKVRLKSLTEVKVRFFEHMAAPDDFIKTMMEDFDGFGGGYARKSLIIKAGRPGVGKTAETLQEVMGISTQRNEGVAAVFSQEMNDIQVIQRMISCKSGINYTRIRRKYVMQDESEKAKFVEAFDMVSKLPIFVSDASGMTIKDVRAACNELVRKEGRLSVIALDYLTLLTIEQRPGELWNKAVGRVVWECKQMAKDFDCPFILICMMGRSGEEGDKEPALSDLKESGEIEQHADTVEFFWIDKKDPRHESGGKIVTRTIAKGRDTGTGKIKHLFKGWIQRFEPYKPKEKEAKKA